MDGYTFLLFLPYLQREITYDLMFASLDNITLPNWGLLLKERICSYENRLFSLVVDPHLQGRQERK